MLPLKLESKAENLQTVKIQTGLCFENHFSKLFIVLQRKRENNTGGNVILTITFLCVPKSFKLHKEYNPVLG